MSALLATSSPHHPFTMMFDINNNAIDYDYTRSSSVC